MRQLSYNSDAVIRLHTFLRGVAVPIPQPLGGWRIILTTAQFSRPYIIEGGHPTPQSIRGRAVITDGGMTLTIALPARRLSPGRLTIRYEADIPDDLQPDRMLHTSITHDTDIWLTTYSIDTIGAGDPADILLPLDGSPIAIPTAPCSCECSGGSNASKNPVPGDDDPGVSSGDDDSEDTVSQEEMDDFINDLFS